MKTDLHILPNQKWYNFQYLLLVLRLFYFSKQIPYNLLKLNHPMKLNDWN